MFVSLYQRNKGGKRFFGRQESSFTGLTRQRSTGKKDPCKWKGGSFGVLVAPNALIAITSLYQTRSTVEPDSNPYSQRRGKRVHDQFSRYLTALNWLRKIIGGSDSS